MSTFRSSLYVVLFASASAFSPATAQTPQVLCLRSTSVSYG